MRYDPFMRFNKYIHVVLDDLLNQLVPHSRRSVIVEPRIYIYIVAVSLWGEHAIRIE